MSAADNSSVVVKEDSVTSRSTTHETTQEKLNRKFPKWREAMFLTSVAGISMLFGFGASVSSAKKQDPTAFDQGMTSSASRKFESGASLAARALKWGSFYAIGGCGILFFTVWKLMGVNDLQEFRMKVGTMLPRIPKNDPPVGRTEFKNLTDLLQYVIDEDEKAKAAKRAAISNSSSSSVIAMAESSTNAVDGKSDNVSNVKNVNSSRSQLNGSFTM